MALLIRVAGWRVRISGRDLPRVTRLVSRGLVTLMIREGETWAEATPAGLELRAPNGRRTLGGLRGTMVRYYVKRFDHDE